MADKVPGKAWAVVFCGTAVNLCLGILYAWSVWSGKLISVEKAGQIITEGPAVGWTYLTNAQAANPFSLCVLIFALLMIPGGRIQDKAGPKVGAIVGGLFLASGCIIAGLMKSYAGLIIGFGIFGGIGMGIGYAAPTPAALSWFGAHKRGLIAGLVVGGYGGAALYIAPLATWLINNYGVTASWIYLGIFFAAVVILAGSQLAKAPPGYVAPALVTKAGAAPAKAAGTIIDWSPSEIIKTWQFFALVIMFIGTTQSGLLVIANAAPMGAKILGPSAWLLVSWGGLINALGRVGTGMYSDKIGRDNAYTINCLVSAAALLLLSTIIASGNILLLFLAVGIAYWQYGGGLSLMPAYTADFFGPKNLGMNYGLVFIGWGLGFFMTRLAGTIKDITGTLTWAFILSAIVLIIAVVISRVTKRPMHATE
jgi:OFA family oxalate/formate antiporter-like MFS transporter